MKYCFVVLALFLSSSVFSREVASDLTPENAYQQGKLYFQQNKYDLARPLLKHATEHGYSSAAIMYGETFYKSYFFQTKEENKYFIKAAEMGNIIGIIRAGSDRSPDPLSMIWNKKAELLLYELADEDNVFAMRLLDTYVSDEDEGYYWRKKAAAAGSPYSQFKLAISYKNGFSWFIIPGKREWEIERLLKAASDAGYRPAMKYYAFRLMKNGRAKEYERLINKLIDLGDANTILDLALLNNMERKFEDAYYYMKIYHSAMGLDGDSSNRDVVNRRYPELLDKMTESQITEINKKVDEYLDTHVVYDPKMVDEYEWTLDNIHEYGKH